MWATRWTRHDGEGPRARGIRWRNRLGAAALAASLPLVPPAPAGSEESILVATRRLEPTAHEFTLPRKVGVLEAAAAVTLSFEVPGRLARVRGDGARVEAGEELAALDSVLEAALLRQAELRLQDAQREHQRVRNLRSSSASSQKQLDAANIAVELRLVERDIAREQLARRTLLAPFAGVVTNVRLDPGEVTQPTAPIARLINPALLELEVGIPGYQIVEVRPNAAVRIEVPALEERVFDGTVHVVSPAAAEGGHLFEVQILVPNIDGSLRAGMDARASIVTRSLDEVLVAPLGAMVEHGGQRMVYFVDGGYARAVAVEATGLNGDRIVLPASLPYRELVVRGQNDLRDGSAVVVDPTVLGSSDGEGPATVVEPRLQ